MSAKKQPAASGVGDLRDEIAAVRALIGEVRRKITPGAATPAGEAEELSLKDLLAVLDGLSRASERLARMLKSQQSLGADQAEMDALNDMLKDLIRQLGR